MSELPRADYIKAGVFEGDLISREALLKEVRENKELYEKERVYIEGLLLNAPTVKYSFYAEAYQTGYEEGKNARKQGEWIEHSDGYISFCTCNICNDFGYKDDKFCHNCGAKMKGGAEDE